MEQKLIVVRGGGDLATGTIHRLWSAELPVLVLETEHPAAIRRQVSVSEAVYDGQAVVEDMTAVCISNCEKVWDVLAKRKVPVLVDPEGMSIQKLCPVVVVDAILAKKNLGTHRAMAPLTVALGPGFEAGRDVDVVIETKRGHNLGRVIRSGSAAANTGIPGRIDGYAKERVMHSTEQGVFHNIRKIGDIVEKGELLPLYRGFCGGFCGKGARFLWDLRLRILIPEKKNLRIVSPYQIKQDASGEVCWRLSFHVFFINMCNRGRKSHRFYAIIG